jgi:hypothetical protein
MLRGSRWLWLTVLGVAGASTSFAAGAMAQSVPRASVAGEVLGADGEPVADARVALVHRPIGWCAEYGDVDVARAVTDAKGRFRAEVLPARPYSAFATWQAGGAPATTAALEHVASGAFVQLRQQREAVVAVTVQVDGLAAWADDGPLGFRVVPRIAHLWPIPLTPAADGTLALPTLPGTSALLEVATAAGHTLFSTWVGHDRARQVVRLPPPVAIPLAIVDAATGAPVAGAEIALRSSWLAYGVAVPWLDSVQYSREYWRPVGTTDAEGRATVRVPADAGPWPVQERTHIAFAVRAASYATAFGGWTHDGAFWDGRSRAENPNPLRIALHAQRPLTGRVTLDGAAPAAGLPVVLWTDVVVGNENGGGGSSWDAPVQLATTDAQGAFRFPAAASGTERFRVGVVLDAPAARQRLSVDGLAPMLLAAPFGEPVPVGGRARVGARELGAASLGAEVPLVVRVVDATESPLRGVEVFLLPATGPSDGIAIHNTTDGAGRCLLLGAREGQHLVALAPGVGSVIARVDGTKEQRIRIVPFAVAEGTVRRADGSPAGGAEVYSSGSRSRTVFGKTTPAELAVRAIAERLSDHVARCRCADDGRFRLPFVPMPGAALRVHAVAGDDAGRETATAWIESDPAAPAAPVDIRLAR